MKKLNKQRMHIIHLKIALIALTLLTTLHSCKPDKEEEGELITTVKVVVTDGGIPIGTFQWKDLDGAGGNPPSPTDTITLDSGITYMVNLEFLNESGGKSENLTSEIKAEASNHIICFTGSTSDIQVTIADTDGKYPLGLQSEWKCVNKGNSAMRLVLRHQPNQKDGSCNPGETDVDVEFPVKID